MTETPRPYFADAGSPGFRALLLAGSLAVLCYSLHALSTYGQFAGTSERTVGTVADEQGSHLLIQYQVDRHSYQIEEARPSRRRAGSWTLGGQVPVLYDPETPAKGRWDRPVNWVFPGALGLLSLLGCFAAFFPKKGESAGRT